MDDAVPALALPSQMVKALDYVIDDFASGDSETRSTRKIRSLIVEAISVRTALR